MRTLILVVLLISVLALPVFAVDYVLTDLGRGEAFGINDLGQVTGWRPDPNGGPIKAFIWDKNSGFTDIGPSTGSNTGRGINNLGHVVGGGWMWTKESGIILLSLPSEAVGIDCGAINNNNQIAGCVRYDPRSYDAVLWNSPTDFVNLGIYDNPNSWANDINDAGVAVGESNEGGNTYRAVMWNTQGTTTVIPGLQSATSVAYGINNSGQVVGSYWTSEGLYHGFVYTPGLGLTDIGTPNGRPHSIAVAINDFGWVVGGIPGNPNSSAFLWNKTDGMVDLGVLGGVSSGAMSINSSNQIVGIFHDENDFEHIALWTPVPEPSSLIVLFGGVAGLFAFRRRR
jgi:probable HAF family extracellular repeat protein